MANNVVQVKRTNTAGRTPNTTASYATNSQYISAGEFALNMADGILYTSNGSALITVGANQVNQRITNSLSIDNNKALRFNTVNTSSVVYFIQQNDDNFVFYTTNTSYGARPVYSIFANSNSSELSIAVPVRFNSNVTALTANGSTGIAGQVLTSNGTSTYWSSVGGTGTVTSVATGNGMTGGPITATGTVSVLANTGIVANATGVFVDSAYIGTLTANNTSFVGTVSAANVVSNAQLSGNLANYVTTTNLTNNLANYQTTAGLAANVATLTANNSTYFNGQLAAYYTNATNITTGTLPYAQIPANIINTTANFTISGIYTYSANIVLGSSGLSSNGSFGTAGQVLHSNGTATYWAADDNSGGTVTSVATGNGLTGGAITTNGTVSVLANSGITANSTGLFVTQGTGTVVNATGVHVNSTYIGTLSANNASFLGGTAAASYQLNSTLNANIAAYLPTYTGTVNAASHTTGATETGTGGAVVNTTVFFIGNNTINAAVNTTTLYIGGNVIANSTGANNAFRLGGTLASAYQLNSTLNANIAAYLPNYGGVVNGSSHTTGDPGGAPANGGGITVNSTAVFIGTSVISATVNSTVYTGTANNANFVKANSGITSNSSGVFVTQGTGTVVNATGVHVNSTYIGTISANNASFLGTVAAASYVQNTDSRVLSGNLSFTGANNTFSGNLTVTATGELIITAGAGIYANGSLGTAGQVLSSNGTSVYWSTVSSGASANSTGGTGAVQYYNGTTFGSSANIIFSGTQLTVGNSTANSSLNQNQLYGTLGMGNANTFNLGSYTTSAAINQVIVGPFTVASGNTITVASGSRLVIV